MPSVGLWSALSLLPDVDVIGFGLGVRYGDEWGHRGATHSLAFSIALGLAIGLAARLARCAHRRRRGPVDPATLAGPAGARDHRGLQRRAAGPSRPGAVRTAVIASAVLVSHGLLDTLTDGGLGCALLWPFDLTRYFAPWNPIPVAPIGWSFLSAYGLGVALTEVILFSPGFWFAFSPATDETLTTLHGLPGNLAGRALASPPAGDAIVSTLVREDTEYARQALEAIVPEHQAGDGGGATQLLVRSIEGQAGTA